MKPNESPLDDMSRAAYKRYQKDLVRLLDERKVRSDKGKKRPIKRMVRIKTK